MNPDPTAREWLRVVKYFKSKLRVRSRASKRHERRSGAVSNPYENTKEL